MKKTIQQTSGNGKGIGGAVEVRFTLTEEQYEAVKDRCDDFRLEIGELAKGAMLDALGSDAEMFVSWVQMANEDRETGKHPAFEMWQEAQKTGERGIG